MDIWAFGCVFYEMCTCKMAFADDFAVRDYAPEDKKSMFEKWPYRRSPEVDYLVARLDAWLLTMWRKDPDRRPSSKELKNELHSIFDKTVYAMAEIH